MKRILLVDDDADFRSVQRRVLEREGYEVVMGENGNQAIAALSDHSFDLVILDILMPDREGIETISEILRKWPGTNIIAMSGGGRIHAVEYLGLAKKMGALDTLKKPFSNKELLDSVSRLLVEAP